MTRCFTVNKESSQISTMCKLKQRELKIWQMFKFTKYRISLQMQDVCWLNIHLIKEAGWLQVSCSQASPSYPAPIKSPPLPHSGLLTAATQKSQNPNTFAPRIHPSPNLPKAAVFPPWTPNPSPPKDPITWIKCIRQDQQATGKWWLSRFYFRIYVYVVFCGRIQ